MKLENNIIHNLLQCLAWSHMIWQCFVLWPKTLFAFTFGGRQMIFTMVFNLTKCLFYLISLKWMFFLPTSLSMKKWMFSQHADSNGIISKGKELHNLSPTLHKSPNWVFMRYNVCHISATPVCSIVCTLSITTCLLFCTCNYSLSILTFTRTTKFDFFIIIIIIITTKLISSHSLFWRTSSIYFVVWIVCLLYNKQQFVLNTCQLKKKKINIYLKPRIS